MDNEKFLPIGTVVRLKDAENYLMITGFCVKNQEDDKIYDYIGCLYPQGVISAELNFLFDHDQIEEILAMGFSNDLEKEYKAALKGVIEQELNNNSNTETLSVETPIVENNVEVSMDINTLDIPLMAQQQTETEDDSSLEVFDI